MLLDLEGTNIRMSASFNAPAQAIYETGRICIPLYIPIVFMPVAAARALPPALEDLVQMVGGAVRVMTMLDRTGANAVKALEGRQAVCLPIMGLLG